MRDRTVELLLAACQECGALDLSRLWAEVALLAGDRAFTSSELVAHSLLPENHRIRTALTATCGADYTVGKIGKLFAKWAGADVAGLVIVAIGDEANAILWSVKVNPSRPSVADDATIVALSPLKERRHG